MKRWYLFPLSLLYGLGTGIRNALYQVGLRRTTRFRTPFICVGNLSVGGTGKSPLVMHLAALLSKNYRTAVLSRGYGRYSKGYQVVNYSSTARTVGDEAMQLFMRFKNRIVIAVCEDRVSGARKLISDMEPGVVLLDDAMQHRAIQPSFTILTTSYQDPYYKDYLLPAGNLRESRSGAARADVILVTKCPEILPEEEKKLIRSKINPKPGQEVFFSSIGYEEFVINPKTNSTLPDNNLAYYDILLVTGIGDAAPLLQQIQKFQPRVQHLKYRDHHAYTQEDVQKIMAKFQSLGLYRLILTTEKDYVRLQEYSQLTPHLFYWPIETLVEHQHQFDQLILSHLQNRRGS